MTHDCPTGAGVVDDLIAVPGACRWDPRDLKRQLEVTALSRSQHHVGSLRGASAEVECSSLDFHHQDSAAAPTGTPATHSRVPPFPLRRPEQTR